MNYSFLRGVKFAFKDFWRNIWLSLVTITILILAVLSVNILVSLNAVSESVVDSVKEKVDVTVFFKQNTEQAQIANFQERIKALPEVEEVIFISKDQALEDFKEKHKDDAKIMEALKEIEKNPLNNSLIVKADDIDDYNKILSFLSFDENQEIIQDKNYTDHKMIIERVNSLSSKVEKIGVILTAIFSLIAILIVFNAIRVMLYAHREEIAVMRLVGANNWFIRLPFLLESILYSVFACVIAFIIIYAILSAIGPYLATFMEAYNFNLIDYYNQNFAMLFLSQLVAAIVLSVFSSAIAISRYLKV